MNPYLTHAGRALLVCALLFVSVGTLGGVSVLILLGAVLLGVLAMAYYALMTATLALERRLLWVKVKPPDLSQGTLRVGEPAQLTLQITNRSGARLRGVRLRPHMASGLKVVRGNPVSMDLPPYSRLTCKLDVTTAESGRWMLHGFRIRLHDLLGLVSVGEYIGAPTPLKFLPRVLGAGRSKALLKARSKDREGVHLVRHRGSGMELRELRERVPGDPFRAIAWKATARTGRLMVKEVESEFVLNAYLCLDISSTMRGGRSGKEGQVATKLEHAIALTMGLAEQIIASGDRVGLITFDEKVYGHLPPRGGKVQLGQILQHLLGVRHVIDEDLTEYNEHEVAELVSRYLMIQERLDFRSTAQKRGGVGQGLDYWSFSRPLEQGSQTLYDMDMLEEWAREGLAREEARFDDPCLTTGVLQPPQGTSALRRFCHLRGLEIPYRVETRLGQKERGMVQCLDEVLAGARGAHSLVVISDLCGIMNTEVIARSLRVVKARKHKLTFFSPFTPEYVPAPAGRSAMLHELFALAEMDDRHGILRTIQALGVPVLPVGPEDSLPYLLRQLKK